MYPPALPSTQPTHLSPHPAPFLVFCVWHHQYHHSHCCIWVLPLYCFNLNRHYLFFSLTVLSVCAGVRLCVRLSVCLCVMDGVRFCRLDCIALGCIVDCVVGCVVDYVSTRVGLRGLGQGEGWGVGVTLVVFTQSPDNF